jgi:hypothetical protein
LTVTHTGHSRSVGDSVAVYVPVGTASVQWGIITATTTNTWAFATDDVDTSGTLTYIVGGIRGSGNVSSVKDKGTGKYSVIFDVDLEDGNYAVTASTIGSTTGSGGRTSGSNVSLTNKACDFESGNHGGTLEDSDYFSVMVMR